VFASAIRKLPGATMSGLHVFCSVGPELEWVLWGRVKLSSFDCWLSETIESTTPTPITFDDAPGYRSGSENFEPLPMAAMTVVPWLDASDSMPVVHQSWNWSPQLMEITSASGGVFV